MANVMLLNFGFYAASVVFTPSIPLLEQTFGATPSEGTLGLSLFVIVYGIGPLIVSELLKDTLQVYLWALNYLVLQLTTLTTIEPPVHRPHTYIRRRISSVLPLQRWRSTSEQTIYCISSPFLCRLCRICAYQCWRCNDSGNV